MAETIGSGSYYEVATPTASFVEHKFIDSVSGKQFTSYAIRVKVAGVTAQFSFDGTNVHGEVPVGADLLFENRRQQSIWLKGNGSTVTLTVW